MVTKLQRIFDEKNIKRANQALAHFPFPISHPSPPWEVGNREMWEIRKKDVLYLTSPFSYYTFVSPNLCTGINKKYVGKGCVGIVFLRSQHILPIRNHT